MWKLCALGRLAMVAATLFFSFAVYVPIFAQINNWQTGQIIPGTEGLHAGRWMYLVGYNSNSRNLNFAELSGLDLRASFFQEGTRLDSANLQSVNLGFSTMSGVRMRNADLSMANLSEVLLNGSSLSGTQFTMANLAAANFGDSDLRNASFRGANLSFASFYNARLVGADFTGANIQGSLLTFKYLNPALPNDFSKEQLYSTASYQEKNLDGVGLGGAQLEGWDFTDQMITNASFAGSTLAKEQLYSTASYQQKNLRGIQLGDELDLRDWDFSGQDLTGASFRMRTNLTGTNFTDATIAGANFEQLVGESHRTTLTKEQIYSTASYKQKHLVGIRLAHTNLRNIDLSGQDLRDASLTRTDLTDANLSGALIHATKPQGRDQSGSFFGPLITRSQFYSTGSYQQKNLRGIYFQLSTMNGWDLSGQDLRNSSFPTDLRNANLTDAVINEAWFDTSRLSQEQLYSTASYKNKDLSGLAITSQSLSGWDLSGQNLSRMWFYNTQVNGADFSDAIISGVSFSTARISAEQLYSTASYQQHQLQGVSWEEGDLTGWDFHGQDLTGARFGLVTLTEANFTDALVKFASLGNAMSREQLFSTASYRNKDLRGIQVYGLDLRNADLRGQRLTEATFNFYDESNLEGADLSFADLRSAVGNLAGATTRSAILPSGQIQGLDLRAGESLAIHDVAQSAYRAAEGFYTIRVSESFKLESDAELQLVLDGDGWNSQISFDPGIAVDLGGTLDIQFESDFDFASNVGKAFDLFDWSSVAPRGNFQVTSSQRWDLSNLYTTGEIILLPLVHDAGDLDHDGALTALDMDQLSAAIRRGGSSKEYDINGDGTLDQADRSSWIHERAHSFFGDSNLDGYFDSTDMVSVFQSGEYEDSIAGNSSWVTGDWNGDVEFNTDDFVVAFQDGGYERVSRAVAIPESSGLGVLVIAVVTLYWHSSGKQ